MVLFSQLRVLMERKEKQRLRNLFLLNNLSLIGMIHLISKSNACITYNNAWCKIILKQTKHFSSLLKERFSKNVPATPGQKRYLEDGFKLDIHNTRLARVEVESFHFKFVSKCIKHKVGQICIVCNSASFSGKRTHGV